MALFEVIYTETVQINKTVVLEAASVAEAIHFVENYSDGPFIIPVDETESDPWGMKVVSACPAGENAIQKYELSRIQFFKLVAMMAATAKGDNKN